MVEKELNLHNKKLSKIDHLQDDLVSVVLSSNRLTSLPPVIGNLSVLKKLDISHNLLSSLPEEFGKLKNLEVLCMVSNRSLGTNDST
jgi:Leucine-rich repeat (LRR) protein